MSEELEGVLDKAIEGEEGTVEGENELSPAEEKAMASGWRPQEEWEGDPDEWVDAKTFNRNGEFMSRIQHQSKQLLSQNEELENLKAAMKELGEHNRKIAEQEYKKAVAALKAQKVEALKEEDHVSVVEIDDKIDELKESKKEMDNAAKAEEDHPADNDDVAPSPVFTEWASTNQWYHNDVVMRGAADAIGMAYAESHQGAPIEDVLKHVTEKMKEEFPAKFGITKQASASAVTEKSGTGKRAKKAKYTPKDLDDEQRQFAKTFVANGVFESEQEYVDQLVAAGDL